MTRPRAVNLVIFALALLGTLLTVLALGQAAPALLPLWLAAIGLLAWRSGGRAE